MKLNEQIEVAWKEQCENFSKASERRMFEMGYRAALKSIYQDSGVDELRDWTNAADDCWDTPFWGLVDGKWIRIISAWIGEGYKTCKLASIPEEVKATHIVRLIANLPSPSEVFGEEGV